MSTALTFLARLPLPPSIRWRLSGERFQPFGYTEPNRYPWLFAFAREILEPGAHILSFGCSTGEELLSLHRHFPQALIRGIDINPRSISIARARTVEISQMQLACVATTKGEATASYDALFCLAVLCDGRLTSRSHQSAAPLFPFARFEEAVIDFARCLRPGGYLFLLTTNFRFSDTAAAAEFDVVFQAEEGQLAADLIYNRDNRLMKGERYRDVVFRKREGDGR